ncbi:MAG: hypothetical protein N3G75_06395 [Methanothrix sp.]|nr:hypothetical protein [Methanothrix sp.]MCX8207445.1 hypothetical protein [Methanothrix sp.]
MNDWILGLLIAEGIPLLALVYYLEHKRRMYLLERGCVIVDSHERWAERKLCNGLFLMLAGAFVLSMHALASIFGIDVRPTLEQILTGFLILSAGLSLLLGTILLQRARKSSSRLENYETHSVSETGKGVTWK